MYRRQLLENDDRNFIQGNPRRMRTYNAALSDKPSVLRAQAVKPLSGADLEPVQKSWIGKKLIYMASGKDDIELSGFRQGLQHNPNNSVSEYLIAQYARPNIYRIIYPNTKFAYDHRPGRMNVFVDGNDIIRDIQFF